jgi:hypothetical protein
VQWDVTVNRELAFSQYIMKAGHSLATTMLAWRGVDISHINAAAVDLHCKHLEAQSGMHDPLAGMARTFTINPLELIFFKSTDSFQPALEQLKAYTEWQLNADTFHTDSSNHLHQHFGMLLGQVYNLSEQPHSKQGLVCAVDAAGNK